MYLVASVLPQYRIACPDMIRGFAIGWDYAISWLVVLPFELITAGLTIKFWRSDINIGVWITVFLAILVAIQFFGVRGYGEGVWSYRFLLHPFLPRLPRLTYMLILFIVEFILGMIKVIAVIGFIIFGIITDCGGVPSDTRGYIGAHYWHHPGAFRNGFKGFCSVFVNAAFAYAGTELVGLAAAEAADPRKSLPKASKQVFWRIAGFYVLSLFIVGLIVPSDSQDLLGASSDNTKASPFVLAIRLAGVKGLPSVFNAVITISVISVANSCTFASSRTMQAMGASGMGPRFLAYVDKKGRPVWCIVIQLAFGLLAFITEASDGSTVFTWLLALSGLSYLFVWGSICLAHIRFRQGWKVQGRSLDDIPYRSPFGVIGSWIGFSLSSLAIIATFYSSLFPIHSGASAENFFENYLAAPIIIVLYLGWKLYSGGKGGLFVRAQDMDLTTGLRSLDMEPMVADEELPIGKRILITIF